MFLSIYSFLMDALAMRILTNPARNNHRYLHAVTITFLVLAVGGSSPLSGCTTQSDSKTDSMKATELLTVSYEGAELTAFPPLPAMLAQECEVQFTGDPVAITACKVTRQINLGVSVNGRMTTHEEVIERYIALTAVLEARIATLEDQRD